MNMNAPWRHCSPKLNHLIVDKNGNTLATIKGSRIASLDERPRNIARLIAAAPELYEAALALLDAMDEGEDSCAIRSKRCDLRAALAKARGESA